jgi:hypothetical protein
MKDQISIYLLCLPGHFAFKNGNQHFCCVDIKRIDLKEILRNNDEIGAFTYFDYRLVEEHYQARLGYWRSFVSAVTRILALPASSVKIVITSICWLSSESVVIFAPPAIRNGWWTTT